MPGKPQPLFANQAIVDASGLPTIAFMRWAQERQKDIGVAIDAATANDLIAAWSAGREVGAGDGLVGGGKLDADVTLSLEHVGTPDTYGDADHVPVITVDKFGRITHIEMVAIIPEAPMDGKLYARQNGAWVAFTPASAP